MSSRSGVVRWGRTSLTFVTSVSFLRFLVSLLRPVVLCALVINRVMLVCSGVFRWRQCAPGSAPARAPLFSVPCCHCFVTTSQCLAVSLSCLACCRFVLSDMVVISVASLAVVMLVGCSGGAVAMCSLLCHVGHADPRPMLLAHYQPDKPKWHHFTPMRDPTGLPMRERDSHG